ncbi:MAG: ribonuclease D [Magnetospirillum sp.]|nr:ribonuclease D [Magnetospirillum sp.]
MAVFTHLNDLPDDVAFGPIVAVDTETMGLNLHRDRLCVVQLSAGDGNAHLVHFPQPHYDAPNLKRLFADTTVVKLFHFGRFDIGMIRRHLDVRCTPVWCTKIASKLVRTNTDRHGLKDLCRDLLGIELSKQQQTSDWGAAELDTDQRTYAASDVLYLHQLQTRLQALLDREGRRTLAEACFAFLPDRADLDLAGWPDEDVFAH